MTAPEGPDLEVPEDLLDDLGLVDKGDDPHRVSTLRAEEYPRYPRYVVSFRGVEPIIVH